MIAHADRGVPASWVLFGGDICEEEEVCGGFLVNSVCIFVIALDIHHHL